MKGLFTKFSPIVLGLALVLTSCGDDEDGGKDAVVPDAPSISFTAPGLTVTNNAVNVSVTKDSTLMVRATVSAPGSIAKMVVTVDGTPETISAASGTSYSRDIILEIPYADESITVKVDVTDKNEKTGTATLSVNVEAQTLPYFALTDPISITMGGSVSGNFGRWDLDLPEGYGGWDLNGKHADKVPNMDSFYNTLSLNNTDTESNRFSDTDARFLITDLTKADFDEMTDDRVLRDLDITEKYLQFIEVGQVIAFKTNLGKRGFMYVEAHTEASDDLDLLIKMQVLP